MLRIRVCSLVQVHERKPFNIVFCGLLSALFLSGCGGGGGATNGGGGGSGGGVGTPAPALTSISPASAIINSAAITIYLYGSNFGAAPTVLWNGSSLPTTLVSSTEISANVPASDFLAIGAASITVSNSEGGGKSPAQNFTIVAAPTVGTRVRLLNLFPQDMVWDPALGKLFASFPSKDPTYPNSVLSLDPVSGNLGTPVPAGNNPHLLSISSDGSYLWVGLDGANAVQRFLLPSLTKDISFTLPDGQPISLEAAPVNPHTVAVLGGVWGDSPAGLDAYIFDDATQRPVSMPTLEVRPGYVDWIQWGDDDSTLYGTQYTSIDVPGLAVLNVNSEGVLAQGLYGANAITIAGIAQYDKTTGFLYSYNGQAIDAANHTVAGFFNTGETGNLACTVDSSLGRYYCVINVFNGFSENEFSLEVFDQKTYGLIESLDLTGSVTGILTKLIRWGNAGLAVTSIPSPTSDGGTYPGGFLLIDGTAVNPNGPADVSTGTALPPFESMISLSPQTAQAGSADVMVTITGKNFTPESVVCSNCNSLQENSLPTNYVNATELGVTIPAGLLTTPQPLNLSVYDASEPSFEQFGENSLTFTVAPATSSGVSLSAVNLSALSLAWDSSNSLLYVGTSDSDPSYPNSVVAVNPATASVTQSQTVDAEPYILSMSAGNQFLYVGFAGATNVSQLQLPGLTAPVTWPLYDLEFPSNYGTGPYYAGALNAAPVNPHTVAVDLFIQPEQLPYTLSEAGGLAIYDDATQRPNLQGIGLDTLTWASDSLLYGAYNSNSTEVSYPSVIGIDSSGAISQTALAPINGVEAGELQFDSKTGFLYGSNGMVLNPVTDSVVGNLNASGLVVLDSTLNRIFVLGQTTAQAQTNNFTIQSFDQTSFAAISSIAINNLLGSPVALVRWGTTGLALIAVNEAPGGYGAPGYGGPGGMLYILQDAALVSSATPANRAPDAEVERVQQRWKRLSRADLARILNKHMFANAN
jgi:hypothetical protein